MTLTNLYDISVQDCIYVYSFEMNECESISLMQNGNCYVAIDPFKINTESEEKVKLAHELGHCKTGAFYNQYTMYDIRTKHEYTADKWAINTLIPENEFKNAIKICNNRWELSEYFGVTEDFMQKALDYYASYNLITQNEFD